MDEGHSKSATTIRIIAASLVLVVILQVVMAFQLGSIAGAIKKGPVGLAGATGAVVGGPVPTIAPQPTAAPAAAPVDMAKLADTDAVKGDKNAPVTIVEFSDYECPFCGRFYSQTLPQINEQYIKTGKVKMVFRDFPLSFHPQAQKAAEAAECAGEQGKYWEMHEKLFSNQKELGTANYKVWAKDLGLDSAKFDSCLDSGKFASEIQKDMADGSAAGVRGTPAFFVNGKLLSGAQPFENFKAAIDAELAAK